MNFKSSKLRLILFGIIILGGVFLVLGQEDDHDDDHEQPESEVVARAMELGDPENGELLFNTLQPEVGFACATCHRVDSTERLVGPGLLGVGSLEHDPSMHMDDEEAMDMAEEDESSADQGEAMLEEMTMEEMMSMMSVEGAHRDDYFELLCNPDETPAEDDHETAMDDEHHDETEAMHEEDEDHQHDSEADHDEVDPGIQVVSYIRTSILQPGYYVVADFPDNLMPPTFCSVFTEQEINDIVAYLLTLNSTEDGEDSGSAEHEPGEHMDDDDHMSDDEHMSDEEHMDEDHEEEHEESDS